MMNDFIQAHNEILKEIKLIENSKAYEFEDAYAKELYLKALHAKAHAIRVKAKEFYPVLKKPERIVDKLLKRWKKELEPMPEVGNDINVTTKNKLDRFNYSDKDINHILDEMGYGKC